MTVALRVFKVVHNNHKNKFLVEWNKPDDELRKGWFGLSNFLLVCEKVTTKSGYCSICRSSNRIEKGDIMQEATNVNQFDYDDLALNKWKVFEVCYHRWELANAYMSYAARESNRLEIKKIMIESGTLKIDR